MVELQQGGNAPVNGPRATVGFAWEAAAAVEADASAYLLGVDGKVRGDHDMVFYNQPTGGDGAVQYRKDGPGAFAIDLAAVPAAIDRIVFCVTIDQAQARGQTLKLLTGASLSVTEDDLSFRPQLGGATEAAMIFGELYRRAGQWKFRAVGQGFNGGLAPLARSFGIDVADEAPAPAPPPPPPAAPPPPPAAPPAASAPISLSKVTLEKPGQKISLEKRGASFGEIVVNLNWSRGKKGFFGGGNAVDLDLGCLFELTDGRKGVVQALGRVFGSFHQPPFIALSGDDRTGDVSAGETLKINGAQWPAIRRVAIFANIYDGVPNWQQTDGVVLVTMPDQPPIEVRMTEGRNDLRMCCIALVENNGGRFDVTKVTEYFRDAQKLDERFRWGLRWVAGSKD